MNDSLFTTDEEVKTLLEEIGLTQDDLETALKEGEFFRRTRTRHHPVRSIGIGGWAEVVRSIRDSLAVKGWLAEDVKGVALTTRSDGKVSIAVSSGNEGTSNANFSVMSKYPKGIATHEVVQSNAQLDFLHSMEVTSELAGRQTWYLLYNRVGKQIHYELSLPLKMGSDSRISEFSKRILFAPISTDDFGLESLEKDSLIPNLNQEIVVDVSLKSQY